jgi:aminoglycoside/choline kinase family phosphotransferase
MQSSFEIKQILDSILPKIAGFEEARVNETSPLAGDASARGYTRIVLTQAPVESVIFMKLAHGFGPISSVGETLNQDDTFVMVGQFLNHHEMAVPRILWDGRAEGFLIVEDVGSVSLASLLLGNMTPAHHTVLAQRHAQNNGDVLLSLFESAIQWIQQLQAIPEDEQFLGFQRVIDAEHYWVESQRFIDHYLKPNYFSADTMSATKVMLQDVCHRVSKQKRTLIHRDFMPWNIHIDNWGTLKVIDFQDLTLGSALYDLVSLLHDRDVDLMLGQQACQRLALKFKSPLDLGGDFVADYACIILQRYLRLAGQFALLSENTGKPIYQSWIPGCLKRAGHFFPHLPEYKETFEALQNNIPLMQLAARNPWFRDI